jgi:aryl-alcohol dehydrogenase-like predicted oxidoreductase
MVQPRDSELVKLGKAGPSVQPIALGCMGMSGMYGQSNERESIATLHAALEPGPMLVDTGDFYGLGHNEMLVGRALKDRRNQAILSVKFGAMRGPDGSWLGVDARPVAVKNFLAYSLTRLGVDYIDIYRPARLDPAIPIEDTVGAIAELVQAGYVRAIGLSEVGPETIRRAHATHPIVDLQIEYSLVSRGPEQKIFPLLAELGIGVTAYGVLSRGLLTGAQPQAKGDLRAFLPRFQGANRVQNEPLVAALAELAAKHRVTPAQLAIAWVLSKGGGLVPVVGARTRERWQEAWGARNVKLSASDLAELEVAVSAEAIVGSRYQPQQMQHLDSER